VDRRTTDDTAALAATLGTPMSDRSRKSSNLRMSSVLVRKDRKDLDSLNNENSSLNNENSSYYSINDENTTLAGVDLRTTASPIRMRKKNTSTVTINIFSSEAMLTMNCQPQISKGRLTNRSMRSETRGARGSRGTSADQGR